MFIINAVGSGVASALVGGLLSGAGSSKSQSGSQVQSREPWGPAQEWIKQNMADGQKLQRYYQQNPFNPQQKVAYQNTFNDLDHFRNAMLPGLLDFANQMQSGQYQRQRGGAPGSGGGYGGAVVQGGYVPGPARVFTVPAGQRLGTIDWAGLNPYVDAPGLADKQV